MKLATLKSTHFWGFLLVSVIAALSLTVDGASGAAAQSKSALAGERVQLLRLPERILVLYCRSLVRELDLVHQRSTAVDRWWHCNPEL